MLKQTKTFHRSRGLNIQICDRVMGYMV